MPLTTINTNLLHLKSLAESLALAAKKYSSDAIDLYPNQNYQDLDRLSVDYSRASLFLSNCLAVKLIELGVSTIDNEITYLEMRRGQFEKFHFKAIDPDTDALQDRILEVGKDILDKKSQKKARFNELFELEIPEDFKEIILAFDKQSKAGHDPS